MVKVFGPAVVAVQTLPKPVKADPKIVALTATLVVPSVVAPNAVSTAAPFLAFTWKV